MDIIETSDIEQSLQKRLDDLRKAFRNPGRLIGSAGHVVHRKTGKYAFKVVDADSVLNGHPIVRGDAPESALSLADEVYRAVTSTEGAIDSNVGRFMQIHPEYYIAISSRDESYVLGMRI